MDISHLKQKFVDEANELLSGLENDLLELEKKPQSRSHIDQVFRAMHTIKGASGMYGLDLITEITHEIETLYDRVRNDEIKVTKELIDLTFSVADHIRNLLIDSGLSNEENKKNHELIKTVMIGLQGYSRSAVEKETDVDELNIETWQVLFYPDEKLIYRGINLTIIMSDLFSLGNCKMTSFPDEDTIQFWNIFIVTDKGRNAIEDVLLFVSDNCKITKVADYDIFDERELQKQMVQIEEQEQVYEQQSADIRLLEDIKISVSRTEMSKSGTQRIYVDAAKLDRLMYLVTELVTTKSELMLAIQKQLEEKIIETAEKIEKLSKFFSENALSIRLVPLQDMILKYQRLIRDLSNLLGKKIKFSVKGDDTELDKNIVDTLAEPIMHLIRNCIDHGIESPEKRLDSGKDETGTIFFNAFESGNNVYLQIGDDGNGIDTDSVYKKAVDLGFIEAGKNFDEKEIFDLIFLPGFSTAKSLSEISGRGVGMDIVRKKIQEIRGEILVESVRGKGTTFTIKLQQTISIIDTLLISSDETIFAIPIEDIELCDLEEHNNIVTSQSNLISYKEELIPYLYLRDKFTSRTELPEKEKLIIIGKQGKKYAIVADKIIGQHQAVIKPLSSTFENVDFLSGASILGDGSIALLMDTDKLKSLLIH